MTAAAGGPAVPVTLDEARAERARRSLAEFVKLFWPVVEPGIPLRWNWHIDAICEHLEAVGEPNGIQRLLINVPPGHMKSLLVSVMWPAWRWTARPQWRAIFGSYAVELAIRDAVRTRTVLESDLYRRLFSAPDGWELAGDQNVKSYYRNTLMGERLSVGVGGKVTGFRGDCVVGSTRIATEYGQIRADVLASMPAPLPRVWSQNLDTGRVELKAVEAVRVVDRRPTVRVVTAAGRVVECTHDHRLFTRGGYSPAASTPSGAALRVLPDRVLATSVCGAEMELARPRTDILRAHVLNSTLQPAAAVGSVRGLRQVHRSDGRRQGTEVLLAGMSPTYAARTTGSTVRGMRQDPSAVARATPAVLFEALRGSCALDPHAGQRELALSGGHELQRLVPFGAPGSPSAGWELVRDLRRVAPVGGAPREPQPTGQSGREPGDPMPCVPLAPPQVARDTVSMVVAGSAGASRVYDVQVADNRNFFANEVLVHNCVICDDPLNAVDATSDTARSNAIEWWDKAMSSRLNDMRTGARVLIMQRLHEDDLAGHVLAQGGYEHLCLPSEFSSKRRSVTCGGIWQDPRTDDGALLFPEMFPETVIAQAKKDLGEDGYAAQHDQMPMPASGGMFKLGWWKHYRQLPRLIDAWGASIDCTFKDTTKADFVVAQVWARRGADRYLVWQHRERLSFTATLALVVRLKQQFPEVEEILVEDKANGPAVIDTLRDKVPGVVAVDPGSKGKQARASACTPQVEAGQVWIPENTTGNVQVWRAGEWHDTGGWYSSAAGYPVEQFEAELASFPKGKHDDQVDATSQMLNRWRGIGVAAAGAGGHVMIKLYKSENYKRL